MKKLINNDYVWLIIATIISTVIYYSIWNQLRDFEKLLILVLCPIALIFSLFYIFYFQKPKTKYIKKEDIFDNEISLSYKDLVLLSKELKENLYKVDAELKKRDKEQGINYSSEPYKTK